MQQDQGPPQSMDELLHPGADAERTPDFPHAPLGWRPEQAAEQAAAQGLTLGDDHWAVLRALQDYYARHEGARVNTRELHDALDERFHISGGLRYLYELFPGGPLAQGCPLAGLEPPPGSSDKGFGSAL